MRGPFRIKFVQLCFTTKLAKSRTMNMHNFYYGNPCVHQVTKNQGKDVACTETIASIYSKPEASVNHISL